MFYVVCEDFLVLASQKGVHSFNPSLQVDESKVVFSEEEKKEYDGNDHLYFKTN